MPLCTSFVFPYIFLISSIQNITKVVPLHFCSLHQVPPPATSFYRSFTWASSLEELTSSITMTSMFLLQLLNKEMQVISFHQLHNMAQSEFHVNLCKLCFTLAHYCLVFPVHLLRNLSPWSLPPVKSGRSCAQDCVSWVVFRSEEGRWLLWENKEKPLLS